MPISVNPFYCRPLTSKTPRVGLEPTGGNHKPTVNKELTENKTLVLSTGLDKILQKYTDLVAVVKVWPKLPEHIKVAIKALVQTHKAEK